MKIFIELQYEYHKRRSLYRDLSSFPLKGIDVDPSNYDNIFTVVFQIKQSSVDFCYKFLEKHCNDISNLNTNFHRSIYPLYVCDQNGENVLNLSDEELNFIRECINDSALPILINTDKDWLNAAYELWKLDKDITTDVDLNINCNSNFCKVIKLILSLEYIKRTCT